MSKLPNIEGSVTGGETAQKIVDNLYAEGEGIGFTNLSRALKVSIPTLIKFVDTTEKTISPQQGSINKVVSAYKADSEFLDWMSKQRQNGTFTLLTSIKMARAAFNKTGTPATRKAVKTVQGKVSTRASRTISREPLTDVGRGFCNLIRQNPKKDVKEITAEVLDEISFIEELAETIRGS